ATTRASDDTGTAIDASHEDSGASCPGLGDASAVVPGRVPDKHRAASAACSSERAPVIPVGCACPDGGSNPVPQPDGSVCLCGACAQDSDCTAKENGRCGELGPIAYLRCSYDECFGDSDCAG